MLHLPRAGVFLCSWRSAHPPSPAAPARPRRPRPRPRPPRPLRRVRPRTMASSTSAPASAGPAGAAASVLATGLTNVAAFAIDADDRLWAGTAAYTDAGADVVAVLDPDDPGVAPKTVISGLHTVLGLAWSDDTLYVASAGRVDAYSDFDGASFAATRSVITFPAGTGEVNGLALGPDGRLRVGISAPCDDCSVTDAWSGSVVSVATDGSDPHVEASGIRAPVGLAYLPGTDDLFVTMNQRDDLGESTPGDWLAVVEAGQDWGFPGCYGQGGTSCTNAPSPVAVLDPHAAVSGVALATAGLTGDETAGPVAIVAEWARGLVLRVDLHETNGTVDRHADPVPHRRRQPGRGGPRQRRRRPRRRLDAAARSTGSRPADPLGCGHAGPRPGLRPRRRRAPRRVLLRRKRDLHPADHLAPLRPLDPGAGRDRPADGLQPGLLQPLPGRPASSSGWGSSRRVSRRPDEPSSSSPARRWSSPGSSCWRPAER